MFSAVGAFRSCERGASLIEYSLLTGLVSLGIVASIAAISGNLATTWSTLAGIVAQAAAG
ncbi:MAG: Flp family type IVb pilin [Pseudomonadota bacterium]